MPLRRRTRLRHANGSPRREPASQGAGDARARIVVAIALVLAVLLPLQVASAAMARLLRPAHVHAGLPAAIHGAHGDAAVATTVLPPDARFASVAGRVSAFAEAAVPPPSEDGSVEAHAHGHDHGHPHTSTHAHSNPRSHRPASQHATPPLGHGHGHADHTIHPPVHAPPTAPRPVAHRAASPAPAHAAGPDADADAHARAHAAGIGHHRHAPDATDVVYLDDGASPQAPTAPAKRAADVTVMLLPARPWWLGGSTGGDRPPGSPPHAPVAHYDLPGERPPR